MNFLKEELNLDIAIENVDESMLLRDIYKDIANIDYGTLELDILQKSESVLESNPGIEALSTTMVFLGIDHIDSGLEDNDKKEGILSRIIAKIKEVALRIIKFINDLIDKTLKFLKLKKIDAKFNQLENKLNKGEVDKGTEDSTFEAYDERKLVARLAKMKLVCMAMSGIVKDTGNSLQWQDNFFSYNIECIQRNLLDRLKLYSNAIRFYNYIAKQNIIENMYELASGREDVNSIAKLFNTLTKSLSEIDDRLLEKEKDLIIADELEVVRNNFMNKASSFIKNYGLDDSYIKSNFKTILIGLNTNYRVENDDFISSCKAVVLNVIIFPKEINITLGKDNVNRTMDNIFKEFFEVKTINKEMKIGSIDDNDELIKTIDGALVKGKINYTRMEIMKWTNKLRKEYEQYKRWYLKEMKDIKGITSKLEKEIEKNKDFPNLLRFMTSLSTGLSTIANDSFHILDNYFDYFLTEVNKLPVNLGGINK